MAIPVYLLLLHKTLFSYKVQILPPPPNFHFSTSKYDAVLRAKTSMHWKYIVQVENIKDISFPPCPLVLFPLLENS